MKNSCNVLKFSSPWIMDCSFGMTCMCLSSPSEITLLHHFLIASYFILCSGPFLISNPIIHHAEVIICTPRGLYPDSRIHYKIITGEPAPDHAHSTNSASQIATPLQYNLTTSLLSTLSSHSDVDPFPQLFVCAQEKKYHHILQ